MNPYFNEDHESIREMARDFATKTLAPLAAEIDKQDQFPKDVVAQMAELGFYGLKIPEAYGGLGLDVRSYICVMEELVKKCCCSTIFVSMANSLSTAPLLLSGTEEQKQQYIPPIVAGESFVSFGLTEPNAGSDASSLATKAVKVGDGYVLNGRKCFITMAPWASYSIIYAKTNPEQGVKGISAFLVDMKLPGVSIGKKEEKMGQRGVPVSDIVLEDVFVPDGCMLGELDKGFINAMKTLSVGRIGVAAMSIGMAREAIDLAVAHTKGRIQFCRPLAKNQSIQFMLAEMETKLHAAQLLTYEAAYMMDNGEDATVAASMAKYYGAEMAIDVINQALQLHGGYGYSQEYAIERLYRDVRILSIYEGSSQIQQMVISGQMLK